MTFSLIVIIILTPIKLVICSDYCNVTEQHVMCDNELREKRCPEDFRLYRRTKLYKKIVLHLYNGIRSEFSNGDPINNFSAVANMRALSWDYELGLATKEIARCCFLDETCSNCYLFDRFQARPLAIMMKLGHINRYGNYVKRAFENGKKRFPIENLSNYDFSTDYNTFSVLTFAKTEYVACSRGYSLKDRLVYDVCLFGPSEADHNNRLYKEGEPCTICPNRCSIVYSAMCGILKAKAFSGNEESPMELGSNKSVAGVLEANVVPINTYDPTKSNTILTVRGDMSGKAVSNNKYDPMKPVEAQNVAGGLQGNSVSSHKCDSTKPVAAQNVDGVMRGKSVSNHKYDPMKSVAAQNAAGVMKATAVPSTKYSPKKSSSNKIGYGKHPEVNAIPLVKDDHMHDNIYSVKLAIDDFIKSSPSNKLVRPQKFDEQKSYFKSNVFDSTEDLEPTTDFYLSDNLIGADQRTETERSRGNNLTITHEPEETVVINVPLQDESQSVNSSLLYSEFRARSGGEQELGFDNPEAIEVKAGPTEMSTGTTQQMTKDTHIASTVVSNFKTTTQTEKDESLLVPLLLPVEKEGISGNLPDSDIGSGSTPLDSSSILVVFLVLCQLI